MKKILVIGNGDSIFVKDFIAQYSKREFTIDLISLGEAPQILGVRRQANCNMSERSKFLNQFQVNYAIAININKMDRDYDCVVIHYVSFNLALHINKLRKISKRLVAVVWGSDFYRVKSKLKISLQNIIYKQVDKVVFTNIETLKSFSQAKKFIDNSKLGVASFGLPTLDEIDILSKPPGPVDYDKWCESFAVPIEKIKIMVGYNASLAHNQLSVIESISIFEKETSDLFHLIFPLGYGSSDSKNIIKRKLQENSVENYTILENFYGFHEVAKLRLITDVLINIQPSDQFSGSMQETLYAGGSVIAGSWLPYKKIVDLGANVLLIDKVEEIGNTVFEVVKKFNRKENNDLDKVQGFIKKTSSWKENLKIWDCILFDS